MRRYFTHRQLGEELRKSEARYRTVLEAAFDAIVTITPDGIMRWFNCGAERIFGHRAEEVIGQPVTLLMPERYRELCAEGLHRYLQAGEARVVGGTAELVGLRKDGSEFPIEMSLGETLEDGERLFTGVIRDISERKRFEETLERLSRQHEMVLKSAGEGIFGLDLGGNATFVNPAAARMTGWDAEELLGRPLHAVLHHTKPDGTPYPEKECPVYAALKTSTAHSRDDEVFWKKDGTSFPVEYVSTPILHDGKVVGAVVAFKDITERKTLEEQLRHQALHDPLSGLPNRTLFMDRLEHALARANRRGDKVAVLFADLDNLKIINDSLGHEVGDRLLVEVAHRLKSCVRQGDTVARLGGDEFMLLLLGTHGAEAAAKVARKLLDSLRPP